MSVYRATSWGRTRRPKNATGRDGDYVTGSSYGELSGLSTDNFTEANGVYKTENQRYVHLHCTGSNSGFDQVFIYNYAAASWAELHHVDITDGTRAAIAVSDTEHIIVEIAGADLIAFNTSSATLLENANYASFSTF